MKKLTYLMVVIGVVQILLGLATLLFPTGFFYWMGLQTPPSDNRYMIGMLAARFLAFGVGFLAASRSPQRHALWIAIMAAVQAVDLGVGVWYTLIGSTTVTVTAFPMFNATIFFLLLTIWGPWRQPENAGS